MAQAMQGETAGFFQRPGVQQLIKFCIIGLSSAIIDIAISSTLIYRFGFNPTLAKTISFLFSVTNGFIWNSRWTFQGMGAGRKHEMYVKFVLVNCVGLALNILLFKSVLFLFTGTFIGQRKPAPLHFALATVVAIGCGACWNFLANKKWTFQTDTAPLEAQLDRA